MRPRLFIGSISAIRFTDEKPEPDMGMTLFSALANSRGEANGLFVQRGLQVMPLSQGWEQHMGVLGEVDPLTGKLMEQDPEVNQLIKGWKDE